MVHKKQVWSTSMEMANANQLNDVKNISIVVKIECWWRMNFLQKTLYSVKLAEAKQK